MFQACFLFSSLEFSRTHNWTRGSLAKAEEFLVNIGKMKGLIFSTVANARHCYLNRSKNPNNKTDRDNG